MKLTVIYILVCVAYVSADGGHSKGPRCYDCNYAPSGYVLSKSSAYSSTNVGYDSCALTTSQDKKRVDKWGCTSGMCFIRRDNNGLVFRGCANQENLPFNVYTNVNCQYQGDSQSFYYFCQGDLCNHGMLGESSELCGPPEPVPEKQGAVGPGYEMEEQKPVYAINQGPEHAGYDGQRQTQQGYPLLQQQSVNAPENQIQEKPHQNVLEPILLSKDVCSGDCSYNPSGLFPYDIHGRYFIQCESDVRSYGNHVNEACTCCKPTVLPCPYGAYFSDSEKVCIIAYQ